MPASSKTELFETMPLNKAIITLALPTVMSSLVMVIYNLSDTYFVGLMNDPVESSAVTLIATVMLAFNAVNNLFGVGSSSMISRALGRHDMDAVHKSSAFGFYGSLFSAIFFAVLCTVFCHPLLSLLGATETTYQAAYDYMFWTVTCGCIPAILNVVMAYLVRAEGSSLHASIGTMSGCLLNIILDPIFILPFGLNMKAAGAGLATFLSNCVACGYFFFYLVKKKDTTVLSISPKDMTFRADIVTGVCAVGIPASIQNLLNVCGMTLLNNFAAAYGATALAAMGIAKRIHTIPFQITLGASQGIMPLVSYNYSSGNRKRMRDAITRTLIISSCAIIAISACFFIFSGPLISLFMKDAEVVAYGSRFLKGMALALPFISMDFTVVGVFQAVGKGRYSLLFAVCRKIVLEIPFMLLLNHFFPLYGLAFSEFAAEALLCIMSFRFLMKIMNEQ